MRIIKFMTFCSVCHLHSSSQKCCFLLSANIWQSWNWKRLKNSFFLKPLKVGFGNTGFLVLEDDLLFMMIISGRGTCDDSASFDVLDRMEVFCSSSTCVNTKPLAFCAVTGIIAYTNCHKLSGVIKGCRHQSLECQTSGYVCDIGFQERRKDILKFVFWDSLALWEHFVSFPNQN